MRSICCTCLRRVENDDAPILTMGAYCTPKILCNDCAELVETVTLGRDYDRITEAMDSLTKRMSESNVDDRVTVETVTKMLEDGAKRALKIKAGEYDFALDEESGEESDELESFDEIPEELQETEEDRALDEKDAEANARFDKFMNWMWIGVGIGVAAFAIWKIIQLLI